MREYHWRWTVRGVRKHLTVRMWWNRNPLRSLWLWLCGRVTYSRWHPPFTARCSGMTGNGYCYCPTGRMEEFRLELFEVGLWGWLSRDVMKRPCHCELVAMRPHHSDLAAIDDPEVPRD
jgi:hypothetical protein